MPSAVKPTATARVSMLMRSNLLLDSIRNTSLELLKMQNQLSSGLKLARPSDNPAEATSIMHLDSLIERYGQYSQNLSRNIVPFLDTTDSSLRSIKTQIDKAHDLALEALAMTPADPAKYNELAISIDGILNAVLTEANADYDGSYLFGGQNSSQSPFVMQDGGVLFRGSLEKLGSRISAESVLEFGMDGQSVFGGLSSQVTGIADLDPALSRATLLADLAGNQGQGIRRGSIIVNNGTGGTATIDLSNCVTVGDVVDMINNYGPANITASVTGGRMVLSPDVPAVNISLLEVGTGQTAHDLGIYTPGAGAGAQVNGQDVDARLSLTTPLTALLGGAGIDQSGLVIKNGEKTVNLDLTGAATLGDLINAINHAGAGVRAQINAAGNGINIVNQLSGSQLTIGETGGATAADLGIRSLTYSTRLADLNGGAGAATDDGAITITDRLGNTHDIDLDGSITVQDVLDRINAGCGGAVTADLAAIGNGIELTDHTAGAGSLSAATASANNNFVARKLGLEKTVPGATLTGDDVNPVISDGIFSHLMDLAGALRRQDVTAISELGAKLEADARNLTDMTGQVGALAKGMKTRQDQLADSTLAAKTLRSDIQDVDFTEAITRYQNLYTALQGNLMTGSQLTGMSLLDFLQ